MDILNNNLELAIIVCLVIVLAIIILFVNFRDKEVNRRLEIFEKTIEDINQQSFEITKMVKEKMFHNTLEANQELNEMLQKEVRSKLQPLKNSLQEIQELTKSFQAKQKDQDNSIEFLDINSGNQILHEDLSKDEDKPLYVDFFEETLNITPKKDFEKVEENKYELDDNFDYEKKICELHESGKNEQEIAKLLNLKESEVAFVLSLNS